MPFDGTPPKKELSIYEKLVILRELLPQSGDQDGWNTCLWSVARRDARLLAAGLTPTSVADLSAIVFFGGRVAIFGDADKEEKAWLLDQAIRNEEMGMIRRGVAKDL
jgi:hypothetical protein